MSFFLARLLLFGLLEIPRLDAINLGDRTPGPGTRAVYSKSGVKQRKGEDSRQAELST